MVKQPFKTGCYANSERMPHSWPGGMIPTTVVSMNWSSKMKNDQYAPLLRLGGANLPSVQQL